MYFKLCNVHLTGGLLTPRKMNIKHDLESGNWSKKLIFNICIGWLMVSKWAFFVCGTFNSIFISRVFIVWFSFYTLRMKYAKVY